MRLRLYNSLSGEKETFTSDDGKVGVYICGITPYDISHLGHAFTYVHFDVLIRHLRGLGYNVTYVQNLTDVDDDILKKAKSLGENWREVGEKNADRFLEDMQWLGNAQPDIYPRASDLIPEIVDLSRSLLDRGWAYEKNGSVYFRVRKYERFGRLSKLPEDSWLPTANERGNNPQDPDKEDPIDFILWQAKQPGEPSWPSPWGEGRPGWHIECSSMAMKYLGETVDISGGGADLIFPHHECSIAQSECATGRPFVRFWMHTAMVMHDGEKMSKSLGNMIFIGDLRDLGRNVVRLCLLFHHYRSAWSMTEDLKRKAADFAARLGEVWRRQSCDGDRIDPEPYERRFLDAMNDDLDTPKALQVMLDLINPILEDPSRNISDAKAFLNRACNRLGLALRYRT